MRRLRALRAALPACAALAWLVGCGGADDGRLRVALNWKAEPEFGGLYEALASGAFARRGLEVEITGGPGAPVVQMVDAGQVGFGVVSADEVLIARDRGADLVAVFATYQTSPQGLMVHAERGLERLADVFEAGGTLAVEPGLPYVAFLRQRYDLSRTKVVPYGYSIAPFLGDPTLAQQVFVTAEPIAARRSGATPRVFLIAESGYNPYTAVFVAHGTRVREDRAGVAAFVEALREGWRRYLDDPSASNARMGVLNPEMDAETFRLGAEAQRPLIEDEHARRAGLGRMSAARWEELAGQLEGLGLLDHAPDPASCWIDVPPAPGAPGSPWREIDP